MNSKTTITRAELFNEVWAFPLTTLANKYAISDTGLRKICVKNNIPLPKSGHWSKAKFGKAPKQPKLPPSESGKEKIELRLRMDGETYIPTANPVILRQHEIENSCVDLIIEKDFRKADPLVKTTKKFLEMKLNYNKNKDAYYAARDSSIGVDVSKEQRRRGLLIIDRIVKILKQRGHEVFVRDGSAYIQSNGEEIDFRLREKQNASFTENNYGWRDRTLTPSGRLIIQMEYRYWCKEWIDKKQPLENQISKIIANMELRLEEKKQERIGREERRKQEEIQREIKAQKAAIRQAELEKIKQLFSNFETWKKVKEMREYITVLDANNHSSDYIQWAKDKVDWFDPSVMKEDKMLNIEDRKKLNKELLM